MGLFFGGGWRHRKTRQALAWCVAASASLTALLWGFGFTVELLLDWQTPGAAPARILHPQFWVLLLIAFSMLFAILATGLLRAVHSSSASGDVLSRRISFLRMATWWFNPISLSFMLVVLALQCVVRFLLWLWPKKKLASAV